MEEQLYLLGADHFDVPDLTDPVTSKTSGLVTPPFVDKAVTLHQHGNPKVLDAILKSEPLSKVKIRQAVAQNNQYYTAVYNFVHNRHSSTRFDDVRRLTGHEPHLPRVSILEYAVRIAVLKGYDKSLRVLLGSAHPAYGVVMVDEANNSLCTPAFLDTELFQACVAGTLQIATDLIARGARPGRGSIGVPGTPYYHLKYGRAALHSEHVQDIEALVELLQAHGVSPTTYTKREDIDLAVEKGLPNAVERMGGNDRQREAAVQNAHKKHRAKGEGLAEKTVFDESAGVQLHPALQRSRRRDDDVDAFSFGIELETCVAEHLLTDAANAKIREHFLRVSDGSIECRSSDLKPIEFVYHGTFGIRDLDQDSVRSAFDEISHISSPCANETCGTHVHMSDKRTTLRKYPDFRDHLQKVWMKHQSEMSQMFYQGRVFNDYCKNNTAVCDPGEFSKYQKLNLRPSVDAADDDAPIHVEFRGWGASIRPGDDFPLPNLRRYLDFLIIIWNEARSEALRRARGLQSAAARARSLPERKKSRVE